MAHAGGFMTGAAAGAAGRFPDIDRDKDKTR